MTQTSRPKLRQKNPRSAATRFVVCRIAQTYWIASATGGLVTGVFPVGSDAPRFAAVELQPGRRDQRARRGAASR